jgi:hypothetical protein
MSEYYTHLLIPVSPEYRPESGAVTEFVQGLINNGNVPTPSSISFSRMKKEPGRVRPIRNVRTDQTINIPLPSRRAEQPQILSSASQIIEQAANQQEYDVVISGDGVPAAPPTAVGYVENDIWKLMMEAYNLEVRCRVRGNIVRLYNLESEEDLERSPDFTKVRPRFGEDCLVEEREGIFVHPETGAFRIANAGCGTFWVEFKYGKFLFPRLRNESVNILDDSIIALARTVFGSDFVQACDWG